MKTTKNIYLAAVFLCIGAILKEVKKDDLRHQEFVFEMYDRDGNIAIGVLDKVEIDYANKQVMVNAADYREALQRMKSVVHSD